MMPMMPTTLLALSLIYSHLDVLLQVSKYLVPSISRNWRDILVGTLYAWMLAHVGERWS